jgi:hypothetical protein
MCTRHRLTSRKVAGPTAAALHVHARPRAPMQFMSMHWRSPEVPNTSCWCDTVYLSNPGTLFEEPPCLCTTQPSPCLTLTPPQWAKPHHTTPAPASQHGTQHHTFSTLGYPNRASEQHAAAPLQPPPTDRPWLLLTWLHMLTGAALNPCRRQQRTQYTPPTAHAKRTWRAVSMCGCVWFRPRGRKHPSEATPACRCSSQMIVQQSIRPLPQPAFGHTQHGWHKPLCPYHTDLF